MNAIEDRLRAATRALAGTVPPGGTPPLRLPARRPPARPGLRSRMGRVATRRVLAPVAAAAAVAALVSASLIVTRGGPGAEHTSGGPTARATAPAVTQSPPVTPAPPGPAARAALATVPRYYVGLTGALGQRNNVVVRATATGGNLTLVLPPKPYGTFSWVSAAADDRTFVLAAQPWHDTGYATDDASEPTRFFLLRLSAGGAWTGLSPLPIPAEPSSAWVDGIALSPDGGKLAVAVDQGNPEVNPKIELFTVATGAMKEWVWPGGGWIGNNKPMGSPLSWTADSKTLAFQLSPADGSIEVRLLDTSTPGGSLNSSALAVEWTKGEVIGPRGVVITGSRTDPGNSLDGMNTLITPDGSKIVCITTSHNSLSGVATAFSVSTGQIVSALAGAGSPASPGATAPGPASAPEDVLWASPTGSTLIVLTGSGAGVLSRDALTPMPLTSEQTAFAVW